MPPLRPRPHRRRAVPGDAVTLRFPCPFCPVIRAPGEVEVDAEDAYVCHTKPTCARFDAIDLDQRGSLADFVRDARIKMATRSIS
jgi:hypothetical protein